MKLSACIEILYPQLSFTDRIASAKKDGLSAIEFWGFADKDLDSIHKCCTENDMPIAACCVSTKNEALSKRFSELGLIDYYSPGVFAEMCKESLEVAVKYGIPNLIVCSGNDNPSQDSADKDEYLTQSLIYAAEIFKGSPVNLVMEPLNLTDHPGTYLTRSDHTERILKNVGSDKVKVLFDIYHQQMTEGNLTANIRKLMPYIGHFHFADCPGRHELGTGEINWAYLISEIEKAGYTGYFGLEYITTSDTSSALPKQFF